jgi:hypothetical protein
MFSFGEKYEHGIGFFTVAYLDLGKGLRNFGNREISKSFTLSNSRVDFSRI